MPNSNNQQNSSGSGVKTAAAVGFGAVLGALAAGAAWYFSSEEESRNRSQRHEVYHSSHPVHRPSQPQPTANNDTEKDEKDGTVKMCEICFVSFEELKECGVQIVSTPCGHVYCRDCIIGSLQIKPECPHCRSEVAVGSLRRLYL